MTDKDILDATIKLSSVFISHNPEKYDNDPEIIECLLESISTAIINAQSKQYFVPKD